jgi:hypothetical protein
MATSTPSEQEDRDALLQALDEERGESPLQRLDRNTVELVSELRVAGTGIQVLFAFLLVVPFNARFGHLSGFERDVYFGTLLCIAAAAVLLIAPSIHHRVLFRRGQKAYLVRMGNRLMIAAMLLLSLGMTGILVLISNFLFGTVAAVVVGVTAAAVLGTLWFGLPLARRRHC